MHFNELDEDKINAIALPYLCLTGDPRDHEYGMPEDCLVAFVRDIESQIKARLAKPMVFKSTAKIALDMAIKFCEQRSISDDDPERERLVDAFCCGFDIVNQRLHHNRHSAMRRFDLLSSILCKGL
ncbi:MAG: hypothetical protein H7842_02410 [Gammaproteobacteria bacterium SHHR-1]